MNTNIFHTKRKKKKKKRQQIKKKKIPIFIKVSN